MFSYVSDFVAKTQTPLIPSLDDFVGSYRDELLLCPIIALNTCHK